MLQQTTVSAVIPYFQKFLERFPTVECLASASEEEVLKLWEGLGYYSRAKNLHAAAQMLVELGKFPTDVEGWITLPGIGRYTAGAIVSFAYDVPAPIVEANTKRLYQRLLGIEGTNQSASVQSQLWELASSLVHGSLSRELAEHPKRANPKRVNPKQAKHTSPAQINYALMDLGATICTIERPACTDCPLSVFCRGYQEKRLDRILVRAPKPPRVELTEAAIAATHRGKYLLIRRVKGEWWSGLWDFPRLRLGNGISNAPGEETLNEPFESEWNLKLTGIQFVASWKHAVTRHRIQLHLYTGQATRSKVPDREQVWVHPQEFKEYPLSSPGRKVAGLLSQDRKKK